MPLHSVSCSEAATGQWEQHCTCLGNLQTAQLCADLRSRAALWLLRVNLYMPAASWLSADTEEDTSEVEAAEGTRICRAARALRTWRSK